jgi:hypothetical protein
MGNLVVFPNFLVSDGTETKLLENESCRLSWTYECGLFVPKIRVELDSYFLPFGRCSRGCQESSRPLPGGHLTTRNYHLGG